MRWGWEWRADWYWCSVVQVSVWNSLTAMTISLFPTGKDLHFCPQVTQAGVWWCCSSQSWLLVMPPLPMSHISCHDDGDHTPWLPCFVLRGLTFECWSYHRTNLGTMGQHWGCWVNFLDREGWECQNHHQPPSMVARVDISSEGYQFRVQVLCMNLHRS